MEIDILTVQALAYATAFLAGTGKAISTEIGKDLWKLVKSPFKSDKEKKLIEDLEKAPDDVKTQAQVEYVLAEKLEHDKDLTQQLLDIITQLAEKDNSAVKNTEINIDKVEGDFINIDTVKGDIVMGNKTS